MNTELKPTQKISRMKQEFLTYRKKNNRKIKHYRKTK
jgi:hypothetical protein